MQLPGWLQRIKDVWMAFSHALGMVMSKIMLTVLWLVVFGIYALCIRVAALFKKKDVTPHWIPMEPEFENSMKHQF